MLNNIESNLYKRNYNEIVFVDTDTLDIKYERYSSLVLRFSKTDFETTDNKIYMHRIASILSYVILFFEPNTDKKRPKLKFFTQSAHTKKFVDIATAFNYKVKIINHDVKKWKFKKIKDDYKPISPFTSPPGSRKLESLICIPDKKLDFSQELNELEHLINNSLVLKPKKPIDMI